MEKLTHQQLLDAAADRVAAKWPNVDRERERAIMADWDDFRLATSYADLSEQDTAAAAKIYDGAPGYDSADIGGLAAVNPLD